MASEILMPKLGLTMKTGTLVKWLKEEGDRVVSGDPLFEVEPQEKVDNWKDKTIDELELSVRAYNCLRRAGCCSVGDVLRLAEDSEKGLMRIRNLGTKSAKEILEKIEEKSKRKKRGKESRN